MKLKAMLNLLQVIDKPIRIFAGCMTIFSGKVSDLFTKEWNLKIRHYLDCEVINMRDINGVFVLAI